MLRGERHELSLESLDSANDTPSRAGLLRDVRERDRSSVEPVPPSKHDSNAGFPAHTKKRLSRFKQQGVRREEERTEKSEGPGRSVHGAMSVAQEGESIHQENEQRLASMSESEISQEQEELKAHLSPTLIKLLKGRAARPTASYAPSGRSSSNVSAKLALKDGSQASQSTQDDGPKSVVSSQDHPAVVPASEPSSRSQAEVPSQAPNALPIWEESVHFPKPPRPPELDLNDPDFNEKLHSAYFPALPTDPSSLSWMDPITDEERAEYSPSSPALAVSTLRFDFKGRLISPRRARQIPVTKGLHHHGDAPESAGYTIPELAHLARSVIPGQRCIAYQTLGRLLYRLGRGEYHREGDDLYEGLWELIEKSQVLDDMIQVAAREHEGHRSVWAYATDAVHLWRKGGGKRWQGR